MTTEVLERRGRSRPGVNHCIVDVFKCIADNIPMMPDDSAADTILDEPGPRKGGNGETARRIEDMILQGEVLPGERLNELALSRRLGISRAALREAVRGLEQLALVKVVPNRGVVVRQVSMKDALDLYDLRAALFRGAARLVARRALPDALSQLRVANDRMREAALAECFVDYYAHNLDFHTALMVASGNPPIAEAYDKAVKGLHLFRRRSLVHPAQLDFSLREHDELLAAIVAHDVAAAGEAAERHIMLGRDRMLDTLNGIPA